MQPSRLALNRDMECRSVVGCVLREFLSERADGRAEIIALNCGLPQSLHGIPAFSNCIGHLRNRAVQHFLRYSRTAFEQLGVEPQQHAVEALKQSVVKVPGNACALAHARIQCHLELMGASAGPAASTRAKVLLRRECLALEQAQKSQPRQGLIAAQLTYCSAGWA